MPGYNFSKIEKKWRKIWLREKIYEPNLEKAKKPFYNLMMFPYPSAEGLHVGNMYAFTGADIYGRFMRMKGYDVFEPIGLDGFGIHSENYALKIGTHPMKQAKISEKRFYKQLEMIGNGFAWSKKLETYKPDYYRWTQWIFIQMFKNNLAYRKKALVNWCPSCKTVLADEQVIGGKCERCDALVEKKELEQWFFRITKYADRLLKNLDKIDWPEKIKIAQRNWIGKIKGAIIKFPIYNSQFSVKVFTTRPDTLFGATYLVLGPHHELIFKLKSQISNFEEVNNYIKKVKKDSELEKIFENNKDKTGVELKGIKAINPANNEKIPVFVADYVLDSVGTGAIMAVPAHDQRDFEFAKKFNLPIKMVVCPNYPDLSCPVLDKAYEGSGYLVNSGQFSGMDSEKAKKKIVDFVQGVWKTQYRLRDWLISRQRYWGPPIPMIFCSNCANLGKGEKSTMPGWYSVSEKDLPVKLPFIKEFRPKGKGESPLASVKSFYEVKCPQCGSKARRETDVSDTFLDSAWYYLRYPSAEEKNSAWNKKIIKKWLPVDLYIGGAEHAVLHLLYVRFLAMVFYDLGLLHFEEPFPKFRAHGLLIKNGAKMSKSKGNIVNPDEYIKKFGVDAFRMYLMFLAPFEQGGDFRDAGILGIVRFLERIWKLAEKYNKESKIKKIKSDSNHLEKFFHKTIKKVTEDIENLHYNTAISALMILLNEMEKNYNLLRKDHWLIFLKLLAPFAPYITEELWYKFGSKFSIHRAKWPQYNPRFLEEETFVLIIQINGKVRDRIEVRKNISQKEIEALVFKRERVRMFLKEQKPKKIVFVPGRLINIVII